MPHSRRDFLNGLTALTVGAAGAIAAKPAEAGPIRHGGDAKHRYAMVVDVRRCIGCQACTVSCSMENQAPISHFRTVVSQYELKDSDRGGASVGVHVLPRLCNHCDDPPCVPVCPVQATFQQLDGKVLVNSDVCVGCGYCVQACPYDARFINPDTNTADKCTFCTHRVDAGLLPACVETCVGGARMFGDILNPDSAVSKLLAGNSVKVLRPEMSTNPHVFYIGLDERFQGKVDGQAPVHVIRDAKGREIDA